MENKIFNLILNLSAFHAASVEVIEITINNTPEYLQFKAVISGYLYDCLLVNGQDLTAVEAISNGDGNVMLHCSFLKK